VLHIVAVEGALPDPNTVGPGMGALAVFVFLLIAGVFLFRSLNKQLKRIDFDEQSPSAPTVDSEGKPTS
jgi:hypothetical protein